MSNTTTYNTMPRPAFNGPRCAYKCPYYDSGAVITGCMLSGKVLKHEGASPALRCEKCLELFPKEEVSHE